MNWILLFGGLLSWVTATLAPGTASLVLRIVAAVLFGVALVLLLLA